MTLVVILDTGPLGLVTNPKGGDGAQECQQWLQDLLQAGVRVRVPAIADYELRRELIRAGKAAGLDRLDLLATELGYLPLTREVMAEAAAVWAFARTTGQPTAPDASLDADGLLVAQARLAATMMRFSRREAADLIQVIIATTNVKHLSRFCQAELWSGITALRTRKKRRDR